MKTKHIYAILTAALATLGMAACTKPAPSPGPDGGDPEPSTTVTVRMADYQTQGLAAADDADWAGLQACLFEEGRMTAVYDNPTATSGGYTFRVASDTGTCYVLTAADELADLPALCQQGISEQEWLALMAGTGSDNRPIRFFSGSVALTGEPTAEVTLTRAFARLDLRLNLIGKAAVESLTLEEVTLETPLAGTAAPERFGTLTFRPEAPYTDDTAGVAYLYPQATEATLRAEVRINDNLYTCREAMPNPIRRNSIYVVTVNQDNVSEEIRLSIEEWEKGEDSDLHPDLDGAVAIDAERSALPAGATLSADGTMLTLPHNQTDFRLAIDCDDELKAVPVTGSHLTIETDGSARALDGRNAFRIRKPLFVPGMEAEEVRILFRRKGLNNVYPEDGITVCLSANPVVVEGELSFDVESHRFDFGRYIDNELGRFTVPADKRLTVEFGDEDPWIRLTPVEGSNVWRVVAGWKPNDPTADGRTQQATLVVSNTDGSAREEYIVSRRNYGLPVTWMHGIWWCKYNARGNSRNFDDQILSANDPAAAAGKTVLDYLRDCSPEEFYDLWGWAYQGASGQGMRVVEVDGKLVMEGFSATETAHINKLEPDALSPAGYELPSMEDFNRMFDATDYVWVMWSGTHTLRNPWEGHSIVKREQRRRNGITIGNVTASDLLYFGMSSPDFPEYEAVTWYGPSAQWNANGIQHSEHYNNILFSVYSPTGTGWYLSGAMNALYLQKNGAGTKDTRILRFKKSPVEYIYE